MRNAPITVQNVVTYDVVIAVDNPDLALKPGMTATVTITTARRDDALRVPLRALRFRPESGDGVAPAPAGVAAARAGPDAPAVYALDAGAKLRARRAADRAARRAATPRSSEADLAAGRPPSPWPTARPLEAKQPARSPFAPAPRR